MHFGSRITGGKSNDIIIRPKHRVNKKIPANIGFISTALSIVSLARLITIAKQESEEKTEPISTRSLGKMGFNASILGMGGIYICRGEEADGIAILNRAFEHGINYYDTATQYGNGESERRIGLWLKQLQSEGRRGEVFVATKTLSRGYDTAANEIERSFSRLKTPYIDLLQLHSINDLGTWGTVSGRNGSLRAIEAAKASGRIKFIGITGHKDPSVILRAIEEYPFDSVLVPLGITDRIHVPFVKEVLPACLEKGISVVAMKVFAEGKLVSAGADLQRCLHYTLSLPVSTAIIGMASIEQVEMNIAWTKAFQGMTEERKEILATQIRELIDVTGLWWKK